MLRCLPAVAHTPHGATGRSPGHCRDHYPPETLVRDLRVGTRTATLRQSTQDGDIRPNKRESKYFRVAGPVWCWRLSAKSPTNTTSTARFGMISRT
jgi:hypothetical protein